MSAVESRDGAGRFLNLLKNILSYILLITDSFKLVILNLVQLTKYLKEVVFWEELHEVFIYLMPFTN